MSQRTKPAREALEQALGHVFADKRLLEQALTHISALEAPARLRSYQRLEFLGDRVLGLAVSRMLYAAFPGDEEGALSRRLAQLVRKETCAEVAAEWSVGPHLRLGPGESRTGGRRRSTMLGDVCEALIGAVFVDADFVAAEAVVERAWRRRLLDCATPPSDAKTALQEWAQARALPAPTYRLVTRSGPDHDPRFVIAVDIQTHEETLGEGRSKRLAEQAAAEAFLRRVGVTAEEVRR